jgi:hypothetical protein
VSTRNVPGTESKQVNRKQFENAARAAHQANYDARGDGYATPEELAMHLADPLACYELIADQVAKETGYRMRDGKLTKVARAQAHLPRIASGSRTGFEQHAGPVS